MIKPRDLVRTPTGQTGECVDVLPNHERVVALISGEQITLKESLLYLVRSATPMPWPERVVHTVVVRRVTKTGRNFR